MEVKIRVIGEPEDCDMIFTTEGLDSVSHITMIIEDKEYQILIRDLVIIAEAFKKLYEDV